MNLLTLLYRLEDRMMTARVNTYPIPPSLLPPVTTILQSWVSKHTTSTEYYVEEGQLHRHLRS
jgi:hypothetical protein